MRNPNWISGKPSKHGFYWVEEACGHGDFDATLIRVIVDFTEEEKQSDLYPVPNNLDGSYSGEALDNLIAWESTHERSEVLFYRLDSFNPHDRVKMSDAWIEAYIQIDVPFID